MRKTALTFRGFSRLQHPPVHRQRPAKNKHQSLHCKPRQVIKVVQYGVTGMAIILVTRNCSSPTIKRFYIQKLFCTDLHQICLPLYLHYTVYTSYLLHVQEIGFRIKDLPLQFTSKRVPILYIIFVQSTQSLIQVTKVPPVNLISLLLDFTLQNPALLW